MIVAPFALVLAVDASPARAALTYNIYESLGNLVVETSGSLSLTPRSANSRSSANGSLASAFGIICTGTRVIGQKYAISGPSRFPGTANLSLASSVSGISTAVFSQTNTFIIDPSYTFGTPIISSAIFNGTTLANIGLTPASGLLGTWTINGTSETINVKVGNPVPGPLPVLGAGVAFGFSRRLRQRIQRSQAAANA